MRYIESNDFLQGCLADLRRNFADAGYNLTKREEDRVVFAIQEILSQKSAQSSLGKATSPAKAKSSAENGKRGGRPSKRK